MLHGQLSWKSAFEIVNHDLSTNYYSILFHTTHYSCSGDLRLGNIDQQPWPSCKTWRRQRTVTHTNFEGGWVLKLPNFVPAAWSAGTEQGMSVFPRLSTFICSLLIIPSISGSFTSLGAVTSLISPSHIIMSGVNSIDGKKADLNLQVLLLKLKF